MLDAGALVPDAIVIAMIRDKLSQMEDVRVIFDGFPRTVAQAESLNSMLGKLDMKIDKVVYFKVNPQILTKRLTGRRTCSKCGEIYHIESKPSSKGHICEKCGGSLTQRPDDREEVISERLAQFEKNTGPTISFYKQQGNLVEVDSEQEPDVVFGQIIKILGLAN